MIEQLANLVNKPAVGFLPAEAGGSVEDRQGDEERDGQERAAEQDEDREQTHAAIPKASHARKQETDPLGTQLARADERQQGRRQGECKAGDGEDKSGIRLRSRAPRQNGIAAHAKSLLSRREASRPVLLAA